MRLPATLAVFAMLIVLAPACSPSAAPTRPAPSPSPTTASPSPTEISESPSPAPVAYRVQYLIDESSGTAGLINYTGSDFRTVYLSKTTTPWSTTVTIDAVSGDLVSLEAAGAVGVPGGSPNDTVSCRILVDGRQVAANHTTIFVGNDPKEANCGYNFP